MHHPLPDIQTKFEINRLVKNQITAAIKYIPHATDGRIDGQTTSTTTIDIFLKKKLLKNRMNSDCNFFEG